MKNFNSGNMISNFVGTGGILGAIVKLFRTLSKFDFLDTKCEKMKSNLRAVEQFFHIDKNLIQKCQNQISIVLDTFLRSIKYIAGLLSIFRPDFTLCTYKIKCIYKCSVQYISVDFYEEIKTHYSLQMITILYKIQNSQIQGCFRAE